MCDIDLMRLDSISFFNNLVEPLGEIETLLIQLRRKSNRLATILIKESVQTSQ